MENNFENLTIGAFAKAAGVNVETIRFYQRKGLLAHFNPSRRVHYLAHDGVIPMTLLQRFLNSEFA